MTHLQRWTGPALVALAFIAMLIWSWGTWPDPLVDFGAQLYFPWRIHDGGAVLYRDLAFYNGPLSQYLDTLWFAIAGVSMRTIIVANLAICAAVLVLIYRLTRHASGKIAAAAAGVTFAIFFAFAQGVGVGNYNWVTPYTHEITHGVALGLLAIACVHRYHRTGRTIWLATGGAILGLTFLTKAEPFTAALVAVAAQLASDWWLARRTRKQISRELLAFITAAIAPPLIAFELLWLAMPLRDAARGVAGSWPWVFDRRIVALPFYRNITGVDDVRGNLRIILEWSLAYAAVLLPAGLIALFVRRKATRWIVTSLVLVVLEGILYAIFWDTNWNLMLRPLPLCLLLALTATATPLVRRSASSPRGPLRLALIVFSIALVAKIALAANVYHYGFALAMPGALVLIAAVAGEVPNWICRRGGSGSIFRAAGLAVWIAAAGAMLYLDHGYFSTKRWTIGQGADAFRGATRGLEVQRMAQLIDQLVPPNGTVAVFPQGLMLNYLTRRPATIKHVNFMPPEVLATGEAQILAALAEHPPDAVVVNASTIIGDEFSMDVNYRYGRDTLAWIRQNYTPVATSELPPPYPTFYKLVLMKRK